MKLITASNAASVIAVLTIALACSVSATRAADVILSGNDGIGTTSFNTAGNWSNGQAPGPGNNYFTGDALLRTPPDDASHTFAGDSLTINNASAYPNGLLFKGVSNTGVVTINNLILDNGLISHANGTGDLFQLDGSISVVNDSTIYAKQGTIDILSSVSGAANLTIPSTDDAGDTTRRFVNLRGASTLSGNITVEAGGKFGLGDTGSLTFAIGASGVNNTVAGDGFATFNGAFNLDLTGASSTLGDSWQLADVATQSFGDQFSIPGFSNLGGIWFDDGYIFDESTGGLVVAPAPERLTLRVMSNGQIEIVNADVASPIDFNYYEVRSSTDALDASWAGIDGAATPADDSWERAGGSTMAIIAETNLLGSESLATGAGVSIGHAFSGVEADAEVLEFFYGVPGSTDLIGGFVEFVTIDGLEGDYNNDGVVDAADYTVWRDGNSPDSSQAGYELWRSNYGATAGAPVASSAAPEPVGIGLLLSAFSLAAIRNSGRSRR